MAIDHSLTYKQFKFKNIPHILRKRELLRVVNTAPKNTRVYADFGCSNGYLTSLFVQTLSPQKAFGFDHSDNIEIARKTYPNITFGYVNLNQASQIEDLADVITCFETLEHVGDSLSAIQTLRSSCSDNSVVLISVPIEIGLVGFIKYAIKRLVYRYPLKLNCRDLEYVSALVTGRDIGRYRMKANGYDSHFGFDYRTIDAHLDQVFSGFTIDRWNSFTTRFYRIARV
jgi:trans-aconitate methyltransferase